MEMTIKKSKQLLSDYQRLFNSINGDYKLSQVQASELSHSIGTALDIMRRYQMMELDRKADIVAMLEELQLKFEENTTRWYVGRVDGKSDDIVLMETINNIIQQKIDALKGN